MKQVILALLAILPFCTCTTSASSNTPPYARDLHNGKGHKILADKDVVGYYNIITHNVSITFNQDLDNVEILIYKDSSVCEQEIENSVKKADFKEYLLSTYGRGNYTICVKVDGAVVASEEIVL